MFKTLLIIISILVGFLPNSYFKTSLDARLRDEIVTPSKSQNTANQIGPEKIPEKNIDIKTVTVGAEAAYFEDFYTSEILYSKNQTKKLQIASTTKLMTAILAVKHFKPDDVITVPNLSTRPLDAIMGLRAGTKIKFSQLLAGLLIESGSDAAQTMAIEIAGSDAKFADLMNSEASLIKLENTHFTGPVGYDNTENYSTAEDMLKIAKLALLNPEVSSFVDKKNYVATDESGRKYYLTNTNKLLSDPKYKGIKTGTTFEAGECLVSLYSDGKRKIIGVILNSPNRFYETDKVIEWTKKAFSW